MKKTQCPKCKAFSGDDWTQCGGKCPMTMSPHFDKKTKEDADFYASFKVTTPKKTIKIGDTVELIGSHPFAGHKGEVVGFGEFGNLNTGKKFKRPKVRLFDMGDHTVYAMKEDEIKVLK